MNFIWKKTRQALPAYLIMASLLWLTPIITSPFWLFVPLSVLFACIWNVVGYLIYACWLSYKKRNTG